MATTLDAVMFANVAAPNKPVEQAEEQASFAAAPVEFNSTGDVTVKGIIITILMFYAIIYAMVLFERRFKKS